MQFFKKNLFPVNKNGFRAFFLSVETIIEFRRIFFKNTCSRVNFFLPGETYFVQTVFFVQSFFFLVETVTEISGSQFLKKDHILKNVTDFLASQRKQFILQLQHNFQPIFHSGQLNQVFCLLKTILLYSEIFSASGNYD